MHGPMYVKLIDLHPFKVFLVSFTSMYIKYVYRVG